MPSPRKQWHILFGLFLADFFDGTPFSVVVEKDLSKKVQLLDVVVFRRTPGELKKALPDGFEDMAAHNLISFKSHHGRFDQWALNELIGHYVNYRKQTSGSLGKLLPESDFRLYAVCVKYPKGLAKRGDLRERSPGVYDIPNGLESIRLLVISRMPESAQNTFLQLFSADDRKVAKAQQSVELHSLETSTLLDEIFDLYMAEGRKMPYTMEDFKKYYLEKTLSRVPPEKLLERLTVEERLKGIPIEELERHLKSKKRKKPSSKKL